MQKIQKLISGGGQQRKAQIADFTRKQERDIASARQQQEAGAASADTERQLSRTRRTPRGRRSLIADNSSTLG